MSLRSEDFAALAALRDEKAREEVVANPPPQGTVEYPKVYKTEVVQVGYNARQLANHYEKMLPDRGLQDSFTKTLNGVALEMQDAGERQALLELKLITEVDRLLAEGDRKHLVFMEPEEISGVTIIRADLRGVVFGAGKGATEATLAEWKFEETGIRLEVFYNDPKTGEQKSAYTGMDFHYLRASHLSEGNLRQLGLPPDEQILMPSLDLHGTHIDRAFSHRRMNKDYHLVDHFHRLDITREDFRQLRLTRQEHAIQLVNR